MRPPLCLKHHCAKHEREGGEKGKRKGVGGGGGGGEEWEGEEEEGRSGSGSQSVVSGERGGKTSMAFAAGEDKCVFGKE